MGNCVPGGEGQEPQVRPRGLLFDTSSRLKDGDDDLTMTTVGYDSSGRTMNSCPHLMKSMETLDSTDNSTGLLGSSERTGATDSDEAKKGPSFVSVLFQTILLLSMVGGLVYLIVHFFPYAAACRLYGYLQEIPQKAQDLYHSIVKELEDFDFASIFRWPLDDAHWDTTLQVEAYIAVATTAAFVADILTSDEASHGNWILLVPTLAYSLVFGKISIHAQATKLLDPQVLLTFDTSKIGDTIFREPEMVVLGFTHYFALNLALGFVMMKDFYSRVTSRRIFFKLIMTLIVVATTFQGITALPVYLLLKLTLFRGAKIQKPNLLPLGKNSHRREFNYLYDKVPEGKGALTGWIQSIPAPLDLPFFIATVVFGIIRFAFALGVYMVYTFFLCLPFSAVFFSLPRSWSNARGKPFKGALYAPFETVNGLIFPPKALLVVSGHLRFHCFKRRKSMLFNLLIGWWLRPLLADWVLYEFIAFAFGKDTSPYCGFLMEEFGPVFPMGEGLGFGKYNDVKRIIENPNLRKSDISLAWATSTAQANWSKNNLITNPKIAIQKALIDEGREMVRVWLKDVNTKLANPLTQKRLDAILPFNNVDGTMVEKKQIEISWASAFFHLLTGGELTENERETWYRTSFLNPFPFMSDSMNKIWFGGLLEYSGMQDYDILRRAFLRYLEAPNFQDALALPEEKNWDDWTPQETVRFLTYKYIAAGGVAPGALLGQIVEMMYNDKQLVAVYHQDKDKFILEVARLGFCVALVNFVAYDYEDVVIFGEKVAVPDGTHVHASIMNANRDVDAFGSDALEYNFNRDMAVLGKMVTFNGNQADIAASRAKGKLNTPPRSCPGYGNALEILKFLIDRYAPADPNFSMDELITPQRSREIKQQESTFMKIALVTATKIYVAANKCFPHASEVKHPLDTKGRPLGSVTFSACGRTRKLPEYDEDVGEFDTLVNELSYELLENFPITDDEGEWRSRNEAIGWRMKAFGTNFPPVNEDYMDSDRIAGIVSKLAFAGMCCLYTRRVDSYPAGSLVSMQNKSKATFVNDNTCLGSSSVRQGYQRYGAAAYFDESGELLGIYTYWDATYHARPQNATLPLMQGSKARFKRGSLEDNGFTEWRHAMWVWRVSALAIVTVADHLLNLHLIEANSLVSASRSCLPIDHPVRSFLKIFTYRTIGINVKAYKTLIPVNGVIARCWAFDNEALQELLFSTKTTFQKKFPDHIHPSMRNEKIFPANEDMNDFWSIVRELVHDVLCAIYDAPEKGKKARNEREERRLQRNIDNDKHLKDFLASLSEDLGLLQSRDLEKFEDIVDVLSSLICGVTGMHELVGQISDYFEDPIINGTTIRPRKEIDSIQIYQLDCTLVASTGMRMPRLMGNWEHLLNRNRFADDTVGALRRFQDNLRSLSTKIEAKNKSNARKFAMEAFNPTNMESSVSV